MLLQVSHKNDDVLHIKMQRKTSASVSQSSEKSELQQVKVSICVGIIK